MMGFIQAEGRGPKNLEKYVASERELKDMKASLLRMRDHFKNEDQDSNYAELKLAESLSIDVRVLRKFINDDSSIQGKTFENLAEQMKYVILKKIESPSDLLMILMEKIDAVVLDYAFPKSPEDISKHTKNLKQAAKFIVTEFTNVQNIDNIFNELDLYSKLETRVKDATKKLKNDNIIIFADRIPSFNKPNRNESIAANFFYLVSYPNDELKTAKTINVGVPWDHKITKEDGAKMNEDQTATEREN